MSFLSKPSRTRKTFSKTEDFLLIKAIQIYGDFSWKDISRLIPGRTPRQCRERWTNYLNPDVLKKEWEKEEDDLLISLINKNGKKWSNFLEFFPGQSYSNIKNRWYSFLQNIYISNNNEKNENSSPEIDLNSSSFNIEWNYDPIEINIDC